MVYKANGLKKLGSIIMMCALLAPISVAAAGDENFTAVNTCCEMDRVSRGRIFGNNIKSKETIESDAETQVTDAHGKTIYKRMVRASKEFYHQKKDGSSKLNAKYISYITFTYDKSGFVKIMNPNEDIKCVKDKIKWNVSNVIEILPGDKVAVVSNTYGVYKETLLGTQKFLCDGHLDVFCSVNGEIGLNSDIN